MKGRDGSNPPCSANESGCRGNLRGTARNDRLFVACFERPSRTREGRISASFDTVRVCLSARTQVGSVSQIASTKRARRGPWLRDDVADMNRRLRMASNT